MKRIAQGAEAVLYLLGGKVVKERVKKGYRHKEIDEDLRRTRTNREAKVLSKIPVNAPKLILHDRKKMLLEIEYIKGEKLADALDKMSISNAKKACNEIGKMTRKMHDAGIIHGDLTTSNMILTNTILKKNQAEEINLNTKSMIYFIDFGLSYFSVKDEDKAVDLHLLRQALESKHYGIWEKCFEEVKKGYNDKTVIKRLELVESRGRNKAK